MPVADDAFGVVERIRCLGDAELRGVAGGEGRAQLLGGRDGAERVGGFGQGVGEEAAGLGEGAGVEVGEV